MEERLSKLETRTAVQDYQIAQLVKAVADNTEALKEVSDAMNKTKGAWALLLTIGVIITFIVDIGFRIFGNR